MEVGGSGWMGWMASVADLRLAVRWLAVSCVCGPVEAAEYLTHKVSTIVRNLVALQPKKEVSKDSPLTNSRRALCQSRHIRRRSARAVARSCVPSRARDMLSAPATNALLVRPPPGFSVWAKTWSDAQCEPLGTQEDASPFDRAAGSCHPHRLTLTIERP